MTKLSCSIILVISVFSLFVPVCEATTFYEAYNNGLQLEGAGKWAEARDQFLSAASLSPNPARRVRTYGLNFLLDYDPYLHLAHCEIELRMYSEALQHLERSRAAGVSLPRRIVELKRRLDLEQQKTEKEKPPIKIPESTSPPIDKPEPSPQPANLKVETFPPGATVWIDGENRGVTPLEIKLTAGRHNLDYSLQGYQPAHETVDLKQAETQTVKVVLSVIQVSPETESVPKKETPKSAEPVDAKETKNAAPVVSTHKEAIPPPDQKKETPKLPAQIPDSSTNQTLLTPMGKRNLFLGLLIAAAVLSLFVLRKHRRMVRPVPDLAIGEDGSTHDLRLGAPLAHAVSPINREIPEGIMKRAQKLPQGTQEQLGGYELLGVIGYGAMGKTFLAKRKRDGLTVALKTPHEHLLSSPEFVQRFLREGMLGSQLHHPNIIRIFEAIKIEDKPFIAMELLEGETLEKTLREKNRLPLREALEIARDVALALDYACLKGIVHRDLKPENIMILDRGGLKVLDYGIARIMDLPGLTSSGVYLGTPSYSAPESTDSGNIDQRSDLYSLGIILYRCLSGSLPFQSKDPLEVLIMHRSHSLPPFARDVEIPESIFHLIEKLSAKRKEDRFGNAESFLVELNRILNQLQG